MQRINVLFNGLMVREEPLFMQTALGYFVKALFSKGLEQLLWNIVVIEALLGDKSAGLTSRLQTRIASVLGSTEQKRKSIKKKFKDLYIFRSDLVHGNSNLGKKEIYMGHFREAHEFARDTILWFLEYLEYFRVKYSEAGPGSSSLPTREDIIHVVDLDLESRSRIKSLIATLPDKFPLRLE